VPGEHIEMMMGCYSDDAERQRQLEDLANNACSKPVLLRNEQQQYVNWLKLGRGKSGSSIFAPGQMRKAGDQERDPIGNTIRSIHRVWAG